MNDIYNIQLKYMNLHNYSRCKNYSNHNKRTLLPFFTDLSINYSDSLKTVWFSSCYLFGWLLQIQYFRVQKSVSNL